jgi:flagellar biosynthesis protein FliQ
MNQIQNRLEIEHLKFVFVVVVPVLVVAAGVTTVSLLQAHVKIESAKK